MSEQKYTPGPWHLLESDGTIQVSKSPHHTNDNAIVRWAGFDSSYLKYEEKVANAKLIAAVPDLLTACKTLLPYATSCSDDECAAQGVAMIRDAIAKAEGRS